MLRGASAEAQVDLASRLDDVPAGGSDRLGEELFGIAGVLRAEPALRRIVTDGSVEADAKAGLARNVFGSSVGETALGLAQEAVRHRWTAARDLPDVVEGLGVVAVVRSVGDDGSRISDELFAVRRTVDQHEDLRTALSDPARSASDKAGLLHGLLGERLMPATLLLVQQASNGRHGAVDRALLDFQHRAAAALGETIATVHTARDLDGDERERLVGALSRQYDTTVHLQVVVDPEVIGGLRVEIGDDVIDGTVASKLEDAQRRLAG